MCRLGEKTVRTRCFTFHLLDTAQCVLEGVQRGGLVIVPLLSGQVELQLFQGLYHLLLCLGFGRLLTAVNCTTRRGFKSRFSSGGGAQSPRIEVEIKADFVAKHMF